MTTQMTIITEIPSVMHFVALLKKNPGIFIIKMGADWCGPCKKIASFVDNMIEHAPPNSQIAVIDIDECFELYAYLKNKKMVNGIPALLCYYKGNEHYAPDDFISGTDENEISKFFERSYKHANGL